MNRGYYCKVGSNAELRDIAKDLKGIEERVNTYITLYNTMPEDNLWCWLGYKQGYKQDNGEWTLFEKEPEGILVDSEDLIDKVIDKKEIKFEKGKWYEIGNPPEKYLNVVKIKKVISNTHIKAEFGFYTLKGEGISKPYWNNDKEEEFPEWSDISYFKPLTLGEVQKYLPDGHPDKIKEFVLPEKWCIKVQENSCPGVVREWRQRRGVGGVLVWDGVGRVEWLWGEGGWQDSRYICGDTGCSTKNFPIGYTEITLEQFKKYALKEEKKKVMYIKCTNSGYSYCTHSRAKEYGCINYTGKSLKKGKIYKVIKYIEINPEQFGYSCAYGDEHYLIGETGIIASTKEEYENQFKTKENVKEEFKIGDWITITESDVNWNSEMDKYIGRTVQITGYIDPKGVTFEDYGGWYWGYHEKHFREATKEEIIFVTKSEESYKIGDYVVITGNNTSSDNKIGDIGVITETSISNGVFRVQVEGRPEHGNWTISRNVRKALPHKIPHQVEYICKADPIHTPDEPKSLLDREEIEVTIKKTAPKQFNIF